MKAFKCNESTLAKTTKGVLRGYFFDGAYIFKGIHYAEAERYMPPTPVEPWEGVKDALSYGFVCPLMHQETPNGELMVPHAYWPQDEHCQNLNIWTTSLDHNAKKPVMVWLHGGGYSAGSSIEQLCYDGAAMATRGDVVVVTINHRLNILGYLDLAPFGEKYANSGNCGHADMVAALAWVKENIAAFGGDPDNVTIFGQSGGGMKVTDLCQIPAADDLFRRGIVISGCIEPGILAEGSGDGTTIVSAMLKELNTDDVSVLETIPYPQLVEAYEKVAPSVQAAGGYVGQAPFVNDWYLGDPTVCGFRERTKNTPLMVGTVFGEFAFQPTGYNKYEMSEKEMEERVHDYFGDHAGKIAELFRAAYPGHKLIDATVLDYLFRRPSKRLIKQKAAFPQAPTYAYLFDFDFPVDNGKCAWHCSDLPFFFHNIDLVPVANVPGVSDKLQEQMFESIMNFAKTGNPEMSELPSWPASSEGDEAVMILGRDCCVKHNFDDELIEELAQAVPLSKLWGNTDNVQH